MRITEDRVAKVVKDRIFSAAFHPCSSALLMAAGDKWGKIGLWKLVCYIFALDLMILKMGLTTRGQEAQKQAYSNRP